jgi:RNA polymerase primary sigma factor
VTTRPPSFSPTARQYLADIRRFPILDRDAERRLLEASAKGDPAALSALVESNLPFVVRMAADLRYLGVPFEDLLGEGNLGLIEAARRFDPARGTRFITYAAWWIRKSMLGAAARHLALVHSTRYGARQARQLRDAASSLGARLGRQAEPHEIGALVGQSRDRVAKTLARRPHQMPLDVRAGEDETHSLADFLVDERHGSPEETLLKGESGRLVERALAILNERERQVIRRRFGLDGNPPMTLRAAGRSLALSGERVRQIEQSAMQRLRRCFDRQLRSASRHRAPSRTHASGRRRGRRLPAGAPGPA